MRKQIKKLHKAIFSTLAVVALGAVVSCSIVSCSSNQHKNNFSFTPATTNTATNTIKGQQTLDNYLKTLQFATSGNTGYFYSTSTPIDPLTLFHPATFPTSVVYNGTTYQIDEVGAGTFTDAGIYTTLSFNGSHNSNSLIASGAFNHANINQLAFSATTFANNAIENSTLYGGTSYTQNSIEIVKKKAPPPPIKQPVPKKTYSTPSIIASTNIGENLLSVGALSNDTFSNNFTIPNGISTIPTNAFNNDTFDAATFPASLTTIDTKAFVNCNFTNYILAGQTSNALGFVLPASVTTLQNDAFYHDLFSTLNLQSNSHLKNIGTGAFASTFQGDLSNLTGGQQDENYMQELANGCAFAGAVFLSNMSFPHLSTFASNSFANATFVRGLNFNEGSATINSDAFEGVVFDANEGLSNYDYIVNNNAFQNASFTGGLRTNFDYAVNPNEINNAFYGAKISTGMSNELNAASGTSKILNDWQNNKTALKMQSEYVIPINFNNSYTTFSNGQIASYTFNVYNDLNAPNEYDTYYIIYNNTVLSPNVMGYNYGKNLAVANHSTNYETMTTTGSAVNNNKQVDIVVVQNQTNTTGQVISSNIQATYQYFI